MIGMADKNQVIQSIVGEESYKSEEDSEKGRGVESEADTICKHGYDKV